MDDGKTLEQVVQAAIYQTRWIDAIKDHRMATDEEIAKAIVRAVKESNFEVWLEAEQESDSV